jgi:hypothetical protein
MQKHQCVQIPVCCCMTYDNCFICLSDLEVIIEESGCISGPLCRSFADAASSSSQDEQQLTSTSVDSSLWLASGRPSYQCERPEPSQAACCIVPAFVVSWKACPH